MGGPGSADLLNISGTAALDGNLLVAVSSHPTGPLTLVIIFASQEVNGQWANGNNVDPFLTAGYDAQDATLIFGQPGKGGGGK
jgi:hypothetical protein